MATNSEKAIIKRFAVFVKERRDGRDYFIRRKYDLVEYNWGSGNVTTYLQPTFGRRSVAEDEEVYDDVRIFTTPPDWDIIK